jgi:hypothetical protein
MAKTVKTKDINLLIAMDRGIKQNSGGGAQRFLPLIVVVVAVVLIVGAMTLLYLQNSNLKNHIEEIDLYLNDPVTVRAYSDSNYALTKAQAMDKKTLEVETALYIISSYPELSREVITQLFSLAGSKANIESSIAYDTSTGLLTFVANSNTATGVPIFISQLRASGLFEDVTYQGYQETTTSSPGKSTTNPATGETTTTVVTNTAYRFSVSCLLARPTPSLPELPTLAAPEDQSEGGQ